jgi:M6 family metalloprotease-like protein
MRIRQKRPDLSMILRLFLPLMILSMSGILAAVKIVPRKMYQNRPLKEHPYTQLLNKQCKSADQQKTGNFNKLLVILVDFQEEAVDDPNTTGNGKFMLEADPGYLYSVGSPPHDRSYFSDNMLALRYYYQAASAGSYNLEYDIYPQTGAYTLPHPMAYYNPLNANSDIFLERMQEYFQSAFELADSLSAEIDFSAYDHFMIIHAGSDWQHDVLSDTPCDLPSFFINVSEGHEAVVDGGSVLINQACNVPSTISQDFRDETVDDYVIHSGYGALNSVFAHEFGHSLGFADLYNVYNWQPMVGVFDIMDSGGSGIMIDSLDDGSLVLLEGALPVLPGAWSRSLVFGDYLSEHGLIKDVDQIELYSTLSLSAPSAMQDENDIHPQILRLPLSQDEYILIENRNVDPDGDGGTAVNATEDKRVILYPTGFDDPNDLPTYEYDYLLPSFQRANLAAVGGGLLVWHINDDVIYGQGVTDSDGNWISNYDNNSVNTHYSSRGVEIIEADNLPDIGYNWSWYWTGTQYEYFHNYKPVLDNNGYFVNWSLDEWKPSLSSETKPPLVDSNGIGSQFWLSDIDNPSATMTFKVGSGFFDSGRIISFSDQNMIPGPLINSSFSQLDLPVISSDHINLLSYENGAWTDLMGAFSWVGRPLNFPIISADQNNNTIKELVMVHGDVLELVEWTNDELNTYNINYPDSITTTPLYYQDKIYVCTTESVSAVQDNTLLRYTDITGIVKLGVYENKLVALASDAMYLFNPDDLETLDILEMPEQFGKYEPVSFQTPDSNSNMLFLMADSGNIYKLQDSLFVQIYRNTSSTSPTQLGITSYQTDTSVICPVIFWGSGNQVYAIKHDGSLLYGYPCNTYPVSYQAEKQVFAMAQYPRTVFYLPVEGRGFLAFNNEEGIIWNSSFLTDTESRGDHLFLQSMNFETGRLYSYHSNQSGNLFLMSKEVSLLTTNIEWNGFRNDSTGVFQAPFISDEPPASNDFLAYVFPNPVHGDQFRVHIDNFDTLVKLEIFDINATRLMSVILPADGILRRDIQIDSSRLSTGVYILNVIRGNEHKRIKFAIVK